MQRSLLYLFKYFHIVVNMHIFCFYLLLSFYLHFSEWAGGGPQKTFRVRKKKWKRKSLFLHISEIFWPRGILRTEWQTNSESGRQLHQSIVQESAILAPPWCLDGTKIAVRGEEWWRNPCEPENFQAQTKWNTISVQSGSRFVDCWVDCSFGIFRVCLSLIYLYECVCIFWKKRFGHAGCLTL